MPQFVASAIIGMISGALASIIESIGGYFAAARMVAAPPVPSDGVNRGILMEGFACLWAGLIGSGCGVTSYSGNIGALAITRNGSPRIMYAATLVLCVFGKFRLLVIRKMSRNCVRSKRQKIEQWVQMSEYSHDVKGAPPSGPIFFKKRSNQPGHEFF